MASKVIATILNLKDNFSTTIKKTNSNTKEFQRQIKHAQNNIANMKKVAMSSFGSIAKGVAGLAVAYGGISAIKSFVSESVAGAKAQIDAETKLQAVMKNTKGVTDAHIQSIKAYASQLQNLGVVGDEVQLSGVQQLATFQLQGDTIKKLMPGMADLLAQQKGINATQQDAVGIGNLMGKVMNGQVGALSRVGINFTKAQEQILKFGTESQKAAALADVLKMNVGGVNSALANTDQGKIQQAVNAFGDMKEEVGKVVLQLQGKFAGFFVRYIPLIQNSLVGIVSNVKTIVDIATPTIKNVLVSMKAIAVEVFAKIKQAIENNKPTWDNLKLIILSVRDNLAQSFEKAKPVITWLFTNGLPVIGNILLEIIQKATEFYNFVKDNWSLIKPLIEGLIIEIGRAHV